jgi:hypothetical protein
MRRSNNSSLNTLNHSDLYKLTKLINNIFIQKIKIKLKINI